MRKELYISAAMLFILAGIVSSVAAFGIATPYWKENPLIMQPGETKDIYFTLQNMVGNDVTIRVALLEGSPIAELTDSNTDYLIRKGTSDTKVNMRVSIPADEAIGTTHTITLSFATVTSGVTAGGVSVGTSIEKSFDVIVGQVTKQGVQTWMWIVGALAIVILILLLTPKKKKQAVKRPVAVKKRR
jgi:hypothetical protein